MAVLRLGKTSGDYSACLTYQSVFNQDATKVSAWLTWLDGAPRIALMAWFTQREAEPYVGEVRVEHVMAQLTASGIPANLKDDIAKYLVKFFPGKRGTGKHTEEQLAFFERLKTSVAEGRPAAVSTPENIARTQNAGSGMSGESEAKGLYGSHQYAVLNIKENPTLKWVLLRNPWGQYGREYNLKGAPWTPEGANQGKRTRKAEAGTFWVELSDLGKRFKVYDQVLPDEPEPSE
jgi:hypothetical protein